jgi:hypothetical protein
MLPMPGPAHPCPNSSPVGTVRDRPGRAGSGWTFVGSDSGWLKRVGRVRLYRDGSGRARCRPSRALPAPDIELEKLFIPKTAALYSAVEGDDLPAPRQEMEKEI